MEWVFRMPVFCIQDYEGALRTMIETYGKASRKNTFPYLGRDLIVSFKATDCTRVFGIPGLQGKKVQSKKITKEVKIFLIRLVCGDMTQA